VQQRLSNELVAMKEDGGSIAWAKRTLDALQKSSPMSLKLTYEQLHRGASMDLKQCLDMVRHSE